MRTRVMLSAFLAGIAMFLLSTYAYADPGSPHVVRSGETLAIIARQHGVSTSALVSANGIRNPDLIRVGQKLVIPGAGAAKPTTTSGGSTAGATRTYVVRRGDTLALIAQRYGISVAAIVRANGIANANRITVGMTLRIPAGGSGTVTGPTAPSTAGGTRFVARISSQHCWLYRGGVLIGDWRCSTGRRGAGTLPGTYKVQSKVRNAWASTWNFYMPYWLGIYWSGRLENGIHGLPYNPNTGAKTWAGMVGTPITFGCVMLDDANAKLLWNTAYIGMPVVVLP